MQRKRRETEAEIFLFASANRSSNLTGTLCHSAPLRQKDLLKESLSPLRVLCAPSVSYVTGYPRSRATCATQAASSASKNSPLRSRLQGPTSQ